VAAADDCEEPLMAWIQSHQELRAHPKTLKLARLLDVSPAAAIGHLHCLWWWCLDYAQDGDLSKFDHLDIAIAADWNEQPIPFVAAMQTAGFLDIDEDEGTIIVHDWPEYGGRLIERREKNAERMREVRANPVQRTCNAQDNTLHARARLDKSRVEKSKSREEDIHTARSAPVRVSYPDDFEQFWRAYPNGNGSKKSAYEQWRKLNPDEAMRTDIMHGLALWNASDRWERGYVKDSARWLRDQLWTNPPTDQPRASPKPIPNGRPVEPKIAPKAAYQLLHEGERN
jgi:hypothetical protein